MSEFSADWLAAREAADRRSRSQGLARRFLAALRTQGASPPTLVDLGAGSGNNAVWLETQAAMPIAWHLIDANAVLLSRAASRLAPSVVRVSEIDFGEPERLYPALQGAAGITCSALLDLVSARWLEGLVANLSETRIPILTALTYSGSMNFDPVHPDDEEVVAAFNRHQLSDKGLGPALGPGAAAQLRQELERSGYQTAAESTPWLLGPVDGPMTSRLLDGLREAAGQVSDGGDRLTVSAWYRTRMDQIDALRITVSHVDVIGVPVADPEG